MTKEEFIALLQRVRDGDPQTTQEFVRDYGPWLRLRVRKQLTQPLRRIADSTDIVQEAWMRFFEGLDRERHFDDPQQMMAFLSQIAHNLLCNLQDSHNCRNRDLRRDQPLAEPETQATAENAACGPSHVDAIEGREDWEHLLREKPPEVQNALRLLRDGHSHEEVGAALGVPARMVRRMIERIRPAHAARV